MNFRKPLMAASAAMLLAGAAQAEDLKIGFVYVSPIGDAGWTYQHDLARKALEAKYGTKIKTTFVESVAEGADAERVIRKLAQDGNQLIFTTSFGYMNPTIKVAKQFPKTHFEHATGYKRAKNVSTYLARFYEGRYLTGIVAGKATKSNKIGYVAAFPIPEVVRGINAFTIGARSVNPNVEVSVVWTSSWYDPGKEREAAETLMSQGADVLAQHTDSTAVVQAAEDKGKFAVGYHSDMSKYGPKAHLTASTHIWTPYYISVVDAQLNGKWQSSNTWGGLKEGMVALSGFGPGVTEETKSLVQKAIDGIKAGTLHPFQGPLKNQAGEEVVAAGKSMSDDDLLKMGYYVEGVLGELPKKN